MGITKSSLDKKNKKLRVFFRVVTFFYQSKEDSKKTTIRMFNNRINESTVHSQSKKNIGQIYSRDSVVKVMKFIKVEDHENLNKMEPITFQPQKTFSYYFSFPKKWY